ncbi:phosphate:acyl-[acyl carrier protein] acyltransferase [[Clostridium] aminophilum]|uniref:Phosphate acyltransferase n=1 Tax=[Clostridium] aminophilum TaxID=1526 RepID=A0A1I0B079_9FIRM|nr:phosphate acyltransferase PlsX [[Clostridium] aminophilum]SET00105.1 phosphate:acyl-[acyl carrier protein] acyltransferase [[Clostridium] aminophilum]
MIRVAVDAMGGDNAPGEIIKGALSAARERNDIRVVLVGREQVIRDEIRRQGGDESLVEIVHAEEVIETGEHPVNALRKKKDSSIVVGMNLLKNGEADAFCSAGSSGAVLAGGMLIVGRIKGVERPPLAPLIPTEKGISLLIDCGANVDAKASNLVQFARMGSIYMKNVIGVENPRVGLVNIGVEEEKGNALAKETYPLLKACKDINFVGNIEAREIPHGAADVIVTEAFTGNVILKLYEGLGSTLIHMIKKGLMSTLISKIGALMAKPALKKSMKAFDVTEYGGAPLLGCKGLVVKTHGSAKAVEVHNTILQCITFTEQRINEKIQEALNPAENAEKSAESAAKA